MTEIKLTINVPDLAQAVNALAAAMTNARTTMQAPQAPTPPPVAQATLINPPDPTVAAPQAPQASVPTAAAPTYTHEQIAAAGSALIDAGKLTNLLDLLGRFGVQAVTQLAPEQLGAFATELRQLGAQI